MAAAARVALVFMASVASGAMINMSLEGDITNERYYYLHLVCVHTLVTHACVCAQALCSPLCMQLCVSSAQLILQHNLTTTTAYCQAPDTQMHLRLDKCCTND